MSRLKDEDGFVSKYWICNDCAEKKGWEPPKGNVTIIRGQCGYCKLPVEQWLTPTCDFKINGVEPVWD